MVIWREKLTVQKNGTDATKATNLNSRLRSKPVDDPAMLAQRRAGATLLAALAANVRSTGGLEKPAHVGTIDGRFRI